MPLKRLARFVLLPELELQNITNPWDGATTFYTDKARSVCEICPRCAEPSSSIYDSRTVRLKDAPMRGRRVELVVRKRRYYCKTCRKPFTEPLSGVMPGRRTTQRFRRSILWACNNFVDLAKVRKDHGVSSAFIYKILYEQIELKLREVRNPWPRKLGIDEHMAFRSQNERFVTVITDMNNKRVKEVVLGKTSQGLAEQLKHIPGRENVEWVALDLSDTYKKFVAEFFPNAEMVADKFHVLRLLHPHLIKRRKDIAPDRFTSKAKRMLLMSSKNLDYFDRSAIYKYLQNYPELLELYTWKERLYGFYRIKGYDKARKALSYMLEEMKASSLKEIKTLRRTLERWENEVLNYFKTRLTNARTEGFNNVAKLVIKRAYGYKSFRNYRLRLLSACAF